MLRFIGILQCAEARALRDDLERRRDEYLAPLIRHPPLCKVIERFRVELKEGVEHGHDPDDVRLIQMLAALFHVLLVGYEEAQAPNEVLEAIARVHAVVTRRQLTLSVCQIDSLCRFLSEINGFLRQLRRTGGRIVLIEMPIGNSIPVKLLTPMLAGVGRVDICKISLSRNDSARAGTTRSQLLTEQIALTNLAKDDVVVYLDEWNTGSNFHALCDIQRTAIPKGVHFLPAAVLTDQALHHPRYESFREAHDRLLSSWGLDGSRFRRVLPALPSAIGGDYFFWSEHDRTAGYRKMQLYGSLFSSFDATVGLLKEDLTARRVATRLLAAIMLSDGPFSGSLADLIDCIESRFDASHADYLLCRDELERCGDGAAKGGMITDYDAEIRPLLKAYSDLVDKRAAKEVLLLASAYLDRFGPSDPDDRYYYKTHAPILVELTGHAAATHVVAMEFLTGRVKALGLE
jgi:hypothetical protein